jgi:hypothetical protein
MSSGRPDSIVYLHVVMIFHPTRIGIMGAQKRLKPIKKAHSLERAFEVQIRLDLLLELITKAQTNGSSW